VTIDKVYKPDAGFDQMRAALAGAVKKKDVNALSKLIAPTFLWIIGGEPAEQMDLGRDAIQNFKVAFGFRALGKDVDGGVSDGPYWETLAYPVVWRASLLRQDAGCTMEDRIVQSTQPVTLRAFSFGVGVCRPE
jgi:hypothetical protein